MNFSIDVVAGILAIIGVIVWAVRLEVLIKTDTRELTELNKKVNDIDTHGSRAMDILKARLDNQDRAADKLNTIMETNREMLQQLMRKLDVLSERNVALITRLERLESKGPDHTDRGG